MKTLTLPSSLSRVLRLSVLGAAMACASTEQDLAISRTACMRNDDPAACSDYADELVEENPSKAFFLYKRACDLGDISGCRHASTLELQQQHGA